MPQNNFQYDQRYEDSDDIIINEPVSTVITDETASTASNMDIEEFSELIIHTRPELQDTISDWRTDNPSGTSSDLLDYLRDLETDEGDEPETINVTNSYVYTLFMDQLRDVAFEASGEVRIIIQMNGDTVLDNLYTPSFDGLIHLDLQDIVRENTVNYLPSICPIDDLVLENNGFLEQYYASSRLYVRITDTSGDNSDYYFTVFGFESATADRVTDIDFLRIPRNYLLPMSIYLTSEEQKYVSLQMFLESGQRRLLLTSHVTPFADGADYTHGDSFLFSRDYPIAAVPARDGEQFRILWVADGHRSQTNHQEEADFHREAATPFLKKCPGEFHQYIFLNKYGHYDNIPMSGAKTYTPEYDIENAARSYSIDKVKSTKREVYTQNTGPQTRATLEALAELLLSPEIFHYIPGKSIRRIVVENPSLTINSKNSINSATFTWRYAGK